MFPVGQTVVTVTATDACGNSTTCTFTVTVVAAPTCNLTAPNPLPNCGSTGNTFTASTTGTIANYAWSVSGTGWAITGQTGGTITYTAGSGIGILTLTVTDTYGCTSTCNVSFGCIAGQGCSPGFWKNHPELWDNTSDPIVNNMPAALRFTTSTNFFTYFGIAQGSCGFPNTPLTMLQAISLNGGDCKAFARHAVSGLLTSASGLNMPYPTGTTNFTSLFNAIKTALLSCNCSGTLFNQLAYISSLDGPWCSALSNLLTTIQNTGALPVNKEVTQVKAFPNPYTDQVRFVITSPLSGHATLEVYNMLGAKLQTVYSGPVLTGKGQVIEYRVPEQYRTSLVYMLRVDDKLIVTGKIINVR